jgi:hypothetical protein
MANHLRAEVGVGLSISIRRIDWLLEAENRCAVSGQYVGNKTGAANKIF